MGSVGCLARQLLLIIATCDRSPHKPPPPTACPPKQKVTSSAKKRREPGSTRIHQTPDGSFYDLMRNGWQVLQRCGMRYVPEVISLALLCLFGWEGVLCT